MTYRQFKISEYPDIVNIHLLAFNNFFLTTLGSRFLSTYYKACLKSKEIISICAVNDDAKIIGFSIGCIQSKGFHKRLLKENIFKFFIEGLIILFSKPQALIRLLKNLEKNKNINDDGNYCDLLSIAILPEYNGLGIGKDLINNFEEEATKRGCVKISLTTDAENNENVFEFYKRSGYNIFYQFITYPNRIMYKMIKELN